MPHAWKAGEQTLLLRRQLEAMEDGGSWSCRRRPIRIRCPPGPYERASLIAYYLKTRKPRSKLIILDAKDAFSKQRLFQNAWKELYPDIIEWVSLSSGGKVTEVDPATMTVDTDFDKHKAAVANIIPPQKAGRIAELAGVADRTGWCPIDPGQLRIEAGARHPRRRRRLHRRRDAEIGLRRQCAGQGVRRRGGRGSLGGGSPSTPKLINTCYSMVAPDYGIAVAAVYHPVNGQLVEVEGAGGVQPGRCATLDARARGKARRWLVQHDHERSVRLSAPACALLVSLVLIGGGEHWPERKSRWYPTTSWATRSRVADRQHRRCRARPRNRGQPAGRALPAVPYGPVPRGAVPRYAGSRPQGRWRALVRRPIAVAHGGQPKLDPETIMPPYYRSRWSRPGGAGFRGKPMLTAEQIEDVVAFLATLRD